MSDAVDFRWYDPLSVLTTFYCEYLITLVTSNPDEVITTSRTSGINDGCRPSRIKEGTSTYRDDIKIVYGLCSYVAIPLTNQC